MHDRREIAVTAIRLQRRALRAVLIALVASIVTCVLAASPLPTLFWFAWPTALLLSFKAASALWQLDALRRPEIR